MSGRDFRSETRLRFANSLILNVHFRQSTTAFTFAVEKQVNRCLRNNKNKIMSVCCVIDENAETVFERITIVIMRVNAKIIVTVSRKSALCKINPSHLSRQPVLSVQPAYFTTSTARRVPAHGACSAYHFRLTTATSKMAASGNISARRPLNARSFVRSVPKLWPSTIAAFRIRRAAHRLSVNSTYICRHKADVRRLHGSLYAKRETTASRGHR